MFSESLFLLKFWVFSVIELVFESSFEFEIRFEFAFEFDFCADFTDAILRGVK